MNMALHIAGVHLRSPARYVLAVFRATSAFIREEHGDRREFGPFSPARELGQYASVRASSRVVGDRLGYNLVHSPCGSDSFGVR